MSDATLACESIAGLSARINAGSITPVQVAEGLLDRIAALDGKLHAFIRVMPEHALAQARAAEIALREGRSAGPLAGIPYAAKDLFDVKGVPTTAGTRFLADNIAKADCTVVRKLRRAGIRAATFLPTWLPNWFRYANLRNHRKIMVVDGVLGFTGGMNIRAAHEVAGAAKDPVRCLHFEVRGPVVADLQRTFATDWAFTTGEQLHGEFWFPPPERAGTVAARGIPDGPDADLDNILHVILGALAVATRSVRIVTPYFLPDDVLLRALQVAAMRGVAVDIVLPQKSNIFLVDWASAPLLPDLMRKGCRIHYTGAPFDHTKLLVVDGFWSLIGSTNWDARSLRLNFEYNLECYDQPLAQQLDALIDSKIAQAGQPTLEDLDRRPFPIRLRNGLTRMLSPYL